MAGAVAAAEMQERQVLQSTLDWSDLAWMRERWPGTLVDAVRAVKLGCDGLVVSNHGGRQLDGAPATLAVLPEIARAVDGRAELLLDGGVRRGTDVVKALALGADAVLIGRPFLYGFAVAGQAGVEHVLRILQEELVRALTLLGVADVAELGPEHVRPTLT